MADGRQAQPDRPLYFLHVALVEEERPAAGIRPDRPGEAYPGTAIRVQELSVGELTRIFHAPMETPMARCVGARGLHQRRTLVGRVPPRGVQGCEISGLKLANAVRCHTRFMVWMLTCLGGASVLLVAAMAAAAQRGPGTTQDLRLVPFPKSVALVAGRFSFGKSLTFEISDGQGEMPAQLLNAELQRAGLRGVRVSRLKSAVPAFRLAARKHALVLPALPEQTSLESYALDVRPDRS